MTNSCYWWLSNEALVKLVLEGMPICWHYLAYIPKGMLGKKVGKSFLASCGQEKEKQKEYHCLIEKSLQNQEECRRFKNIHLIEKLSQQKA